MTWLYIPSNFVPVSECSAKACEPHASFTDSTVEPFVTWSGKPLQRRNLSRLWKRERSIQHLSGLTFEPSMAQRGADAWIASLPDSRARTFLLPAAGLGLMANAPDSSSMLYAWPKIAVRGSSFWRTSQESLLPPPPLWTKPRANSSNARPPESWESWPTSGGLRSGCIFARPTLVPITSGNGGFASDGAWLTPHGMSGIDHSGKTGGGGEFAKQATHWRTPDTVDFGGAPRAAMNGTLHAVSLHHQIARWATLDCNTASRSNGKFGPNIREQATAWPTPAAEQYGGTAEQHLARKNRMVDGPRKTVTELNAFIQQWATPRATDGTKGGPNQAGSKGDLMLPSMAAQWSTPNVPNGGRSVSAEVVASRGKTENGKRQVGLESEVRHWATPTARDHKDGATSLENVEVNGLLGRQVLTTSLRPVLSMIDGRELSPTDRTLRRRLNPAFACWLMGWPIWWTNPAITNSVKPEMELWRYRLRSQLLSLVGAPESFEDAA